ncbi:MAG TPA: alpha/beta hydrolase [Novosphingobium sp.]|nr:alpha/beta hydrolase [Novosphingobium sp.]
MGREMVEDPEREVRLEVLVEGAGPDVVLVPSAMRGADDFAALQAALTRAGYRSLAINPRCTGQSIGVIEGLALSDLADDVALVVTKLCQGPAHLVGHAQGNVFVRCAASFRPEIALSVTAMPCGGHDLSRFPQPEEVRSAVPRCHDLNLSDAERLEALRIAFFAPGNDPSAWLDGWWPDAGGMVNALFTTDPETWWRAGDLPMLIIQPFNDAMARPEAGRATAAELGDRARYIEVDNCGHALLPEQPDAIARLIIAFLDEREDR